MINIYETIRQIFDYTLDIQLVTHIAKPDLINISRMCRRFSVDCDEHDTTMTVNRQQQGQQQVKPVAQVAEDGGTSGSRR